MRVRDVHMLTEKWHFHCLRCLRGWADLYEARYAGAAVAWSLSGMPAQPPWADRACPGCGSLAVKMFPAGPSRGGVPR